MKQDKLDKLFKIAESVALNSPDAETKVGALLVNGKSLAILSTGYNGFLRNAPDNKLPNKRPEKYEYMLHAEVNLLINCARHGITTSDCILICTLTPCVTCTRLLWQAGITTLYCKDYHPMSYHLCGMQDLTVKQMFIKPHPNYYITLQPKE